MIFCFGIERTDALSSKCQIETQNSFDHLASNSSQLNGLSGVYSMCACVCMCVYVCGAVSVCNSSWTRRINVFLMSPKMIRTDFGRLIIIQSNFVCN